MEYKKNDIFDVRITDISDSGEGIGHVFGYTVFIKDALPGDEVRASFTKIKKNYAFASVLDILTPSPFRVTPRCDISRSCGGCQLQGLSYEKQLEYKYEIVKNDLQRIAGFSDVLLDEIMEPVIGMKEPWRYRNKAQYPVGRSKDGEIVTGFYAKRTHDIIPCDDCVIGSDKNKEILTRIRAFMKEYHVPPYDEKTGAGIVRHILIRHGEDTGEVMVCAVINSRRMPHSDEFVKTLTGVPGVCSISYSPNMKNTNVIMGDEYFTLWGDDHICENIRLFGEKGLRFRISPLSFFQVNSVQMRKLYEKVLEYADLKGTETIWDLYCGTGTISLALSLGAKMVYGVEIVPQAVGDARENAVMNGIENVHFIAGPAEEVITDYYSANKGDMKHPDLIVVDPPRKGCDEKCLDTILRMRPQKVIYVSCDPATLSRDLKTLCETYYMPYRVCPVDMFPQVVHIESVTCLKLR